jgi:transcriptional regulator GlxA family with amidase domain
MSIGAFAYRCGFATEAHVSRRFNGRHGLTARDDRAAAVRHRSDTVPDRQNRPRA